MFQKTDDLRITQVRPLIPPAILLEEIPITERASNVVAELADAIADVLEGARPAARRDRRALFDSRHRRRRSNTRSG